ncbi:AMP-binding protein, partial [Pontitalea aquivivens]|uniref:AMP-binding protein n=1 Tax=Pontitalea aquivivens TaxID=3388663 RepID=UPI003970E85A
LDIFSRTAKLHAKNMALVDGVRSYTYEQLMDHVARTASWLCKIGLVKGDSLILYGSNRAEHILLQLACAQLGVIFSPVHAAFMAREIEYVLKKCTPKVSVIGSEVAERFWAGMAQAEYDCDVYEFQDGEASGNMSKPYPDVCVIEPSYDVENVGPEAPLIIMFTSGSS